MRPIWHSLAALPWLFAAGSPAAAEPDGRALYAEHCAACHGAERLGGQGPALFPESLRRLRKSKAGKVIADGRPATQMPGFSEQLSPADIAALTAFVYQPLPQVPRWGTAEIEASLSRSKRNR